MNLVQKFTFLKRFASYFLILFGIYEQGVSNGMYGFPLPQVRKYIQFNLPLKLLLDMHRI